MPGRGIDHPLQPVDGRDQLVVQKQLVRAPNAARFVGRRHCADRWGRQWQQHGHQDQMETTCHSLGREIYHRTVLSCW